MGIADKRKYIFLLILTAVSFLADSCKTKQPAQPLFTLLEATQTGVDFENTLNNINKFNIYKYRNFYNGGGVAIGDINNDGLVDLYFISNMGNNKLYLNKGDFLFEDITEQAGVSGNQSWSTGVSMADVNADGLLDIYVSNSGAIEGDSKRNELFINNGDLTFSESAESLGLADSGYSIHSAFFDYDKDGDLDMYLVNNSYQAIGSFDLMENIRINRDSTGGDKLFRNDNGLFTDVSEAAGIYGSLIGFGLGVTVGDFNMDGWIDIYVSNDFFERDYLYINQGDGTFKEDLESQMRSISAASMGADMADINNDGYSDLFVTDMLPESNDRIKTVTTFESWDRYQVSVMNGYYHQFTRNVLQLNNKNETFSEIGRLAGVFASDWSWGALLVDLDNDGFKDIFIANGIYQDLTNQDYLQFISNEQTMRMIIRAEGVDYKKLIDAIPSVKVSNYAFHNNGNLTFTNKAEAWGLAVPSHSNGSAYGDLDNDGDLDLVVNNVNMTAFIYRNESNTILPGNHYLNISLTGTKQNTQALGAKVFIRHQGQVFYLEKVPTRGFQSTMDGRLHFGLGKIEILDSLIVEWPDGRHTIITGLPTDRHLTLSQKEGVVLDKAALRKDVSVTLFSNSDNLGIDFRHRENNFVDFERERLIYHMISTEGPAFCKADVNGDGLDDIFIGGAKDSPGAVYLQHKNGHFSLSTTDVFETDKLSEDVDCEFFDADGDGDPDLYVASGGNEFSSSSLGLADRLYINNGQGVFSKSEQVLPTTRLESTGCVVAGDYDGDGDQDLFVGIRLRPFLYGVPANGYILDNDGHGNFKNITPEVAPGLEEVGMVTDAIWADIDNDGDKDLVVVGEYMPVKIFKNDRKRFTDISEAAKLAGTNGWWNTINAVDLDNDGDIDFVAGNHGLNSRFKASPDRPVMMYINDFDGNSSAEQIITMYNGDKSYPLVLKHDLVRQIPYLKNKYVNYENYKDQTIEDIFTPDILDKAVKLYAYNLETSILINDGHGTFNVKPLPVEAQFSPVYAIHTGDFDYDGNIDILLGGNLANVKPEVGKYDASYGLFLKGDGRNNFTSFPAKQSGLKLHGDIREFIALKTSSGNKILAAKNNDSIQVISY